MNISNLNNDENSRSDFPQKISRPKKKKSFYIAIAILLTTISVAGWSTYSSVKNLNNSAETAERTSQKDNIKVKQKSPSKISSSELPGKEPIVNSESENKNNSYANKPKTKTLSDSTDDDLKTVSAEKSDPEIVYPTENVILKEFSDGKPVYSKTLSDWRAHEGVDFKSDSGNIVKSITSGTVKNIHSDPLYGTTIEIEHDLKFTAYYCGISDKILVEKGSRVKSGQDIGAIGSVPCEISDGPHLHLMISKNEKFIDPLLILDKEN
ncbi:MAG: peptidoglycan DD-metalloendopeptidase family protein [Acutalibacteraceae bacterium]